MSRTLLALALTALLGSCNGRDDDDDDKTDDTEDTDDTDVVDTDTDDTDLAACEGPDACDGCEPVGDDAFTCDCRATTAEDPATCRPIRVVVLDDEVDAYPSSGAYVVPLLEGATWAPGAPMFTVLDVGRREAWDGTLTPQDEDEDTGVAPTPGSPLAVGNTDVVLLLEGVDYTSELDDPGFEALDAFVRAGGGLVRTEWGTAYQELYPAWSPVEPYEGYLEDTDPKTWRVDASAAPVAQLVQAGLPASFTMRHSIEDTTARTAAQTGDVDTITALSVLYEPDPERWVPGVVVWPAASGGAAPHGTIVWVNSDLAYLADPPDFTPLAEPEAATLMRNVTRAAASGL